MKKAILAILMTGLMVATVFGTMSVSATSINTQTEGLNDNLSGDRVTITLRVYKDKNGNGIRDSGETWDSGAKAIVSANNDPKYVFPCFKSTNLLGKAEFDVLPGYEYSISAMNGFRWVAKYSYIIIGDDETYPLGLKKTIPDDSHSKNVIKTPQNLLLFKFLDQHLCLFPLLRSVLKS